MQAAVIGVGEMGRNHARIYNELDEVELGCVCDMDPGRASQVARRYKVPHFSDMEEMISEVDLDLVSVAVPTSEHHDVASAVIENGLNLLIEKPIDLSIDKAREIVQLAKERDVKLMVGHIERFNPAILKLREMIGELGKPTIALATRAGPLPNRVRDVSAIVDLGVHDVDMLRYILESEVTRLYCECGRVIHQDQTDYAKILLRFGNQVLASVDINWLTPIKIRRLVLQGLEAMFEVDYIRQELRKYEIAYVEEFSDWSDILLGMTEGEMRKIPIRKEEPLKIELREFVRSVERDIDPPVSGEDGIRAVEIATLAEKSGKENEVINI